MTRDETPAEEPDAGRSEAGVGAELRAAREGRGLSTRSVAAQLNLPASTIEAIEAEEFAGLPPLTFVRGYVRGYAKLLGLDADDIAGRLPVPDTGAPAATVSSTAREAVQGGPKPASPLTASSSRDRGAGWTGAAVVGFAGILLAGVLWWLVQVLGESEDPAGTVAGEDPPRSVETPPETPDGVEGGDARPMASERPGGDATPAVEAPEEAVDSPVEPALDVTDAAVGGLADANASASGAENEAADPNGADAADTDTDTGTAEDDASAEADSASEPPADDAGDAGERVHGELRIRVHDQQSTWLEVRTGDEEALAVELIEGPAVRRFEGHDQYALVVGNAGATEVEYEGEPVDLSVHQQGQVARFELGQGD